MLDKLASTMVFSKLDLCRRYNQIHIWEGYKWKMAFKTKQGMYKSLVTPFGLSNTPNTFMRLMTSILQSLFSVYAVVHFQDVLMYSCGRDDHLRHLQMVLTALNNHHLILNL